MDQFQIKDHYFRQKQIRFLALSLAPGPSPEPGPGLGPRTDPAPGPGSSPGPGSGPGRDIQRVITSHADAAKIGRKIADEVRNKNNQLPKKMQIK